MTPAEIIAVKLFGWRPLTEDKWLAFIGRDRDRPAIVRYFGDGKSYCGDVDLINLSDWNSIRRMEDTLAERGLYCTYMNILAEGKGVTKESSQNGIYNSYKLDAFNAKRATAKECVAAALKVLEEAGL